MDDSEMMEKHLKPMLNRLNAVAYIVTTTAPDSPVRKTVNTLIEDACEAMRDFTIEYCAIPDAPPC